MSRIFQVVTPTNPRKPRFKLQRRNMGDEYDKELYGNKQWINIRNSPGGPKGWTLTFDEATREYWDIAIRYPRETYRIVEKR
jgi:hypothetical protein